MNPRETRPGKGEENERKEKKKNLIQRVGTRRNCANRMQKRENPNCKTVEGDTCGARKRKTGNVLPYRTNWKIKCPASR